MKSQLAFVITIFTISAVGLASAGQRLVTAPRSLLARAAVNRYESDVRLAKRQYQAAMLQADRREYNSLINARNVAMKDGRANEVVRITKVMQIVSARFKQLHTTGPAAQVFAVSAEKGWQPTISVRKGELLSIVARGSYTSSQWGRLRLIRPSGISFGGELQGELIAQIGTGPSFHVHSREVMPKTGVLLLGFYGDHALARGAVQVSVGVLKR